MSRSLWTSVVLTTSVALAIAGIAPTGQAESDNLTRYYEQRIAWESCTGYGADDLPANTECAQVEVPVDYDDPDGDTATIALSRVRATGPKIGSLLMNPGGPGASGLWTVQLGDDTALAERFDRVGFDPRGIGASRPLVACATAAERDAERAEPPDDYGAAGIAEMERENAEFAGNCAARTGADFLAHVGTRDVVRDMDVIRAVLGDDQLSYLGYSYGTRLGYTYAETFPDRVRALVLDGAIDPDESTADSVAGQAAGFQQVFDAFATACATELAADCPLGTDPDQAVTRYQALINPLWDAPASTEDGRGLGYSDASTGVIQALYSETLWPELAVGLGEVEQGIGDTLLGLADLYVGRAADGSYDNSTDARAAVQCVDDPPVTDRAIVAGMDAAWRRTAPFSDDGHGTGQAPLGVCAFWPVPNTDAPHRLSVTGLPATVVVSTTEDPATPYESGVDLAKQLGASLITFEGAQHGAVLEGNACVDDAVIAYLVDLTAPQDLTCE
ncbi:alpha/beta hydrolase [Nocardia huaxiensis]|uniref:alpha/beta hydrolase n=1 Tax=Nocardia huaxiensis TaxID=2755382 RepID=UPI001E51551E|nr:alpha/beta hydrolase [Nocardia huaxiensis]UFS99641.1 alpha/beta hydrolase [Nocardia huaxiensis]